MVTGAEYEVPGGDSAKDIRALEGLNVVADLFAWALSRLCFILRRARRSLIVCVGRSIMILRDRGAYGRGASRNGSRALLLAIRGHDLSSHECRALNQCRLVPQVPMITAIWRPR
jgi:hypothetical protein